MANGSQQFNFCEHKKEGKRGYRCVYIRRGTSMIRNINLRKTSNEPDRKPRLILKKQSDLSSLKKGMPKNASLIQPERGASQVHVKKKRL